jgi:hypothetical protein
VVNALVIVQRFGFALALIGFAFRLGCGIGTVFNPGVMVVVQRMVELGFVVALIGFFLVWND